MPFYWSLGDRRDGKSLLQMTDEDLENEKIAVMKNSEEGRVKLDKLAEVSVTPTLAVLSLCNSIERTVT